MWRRLSTVVWDAREGAACAAGFVAPVVVSLAVASTATDRVRLAGLCWQLLGLVTVAVGLRATGHLPAVVVSEPTQEERVAALETQFASSGKRAVRPTTA